jgi:UMF1 family MFS transporter
MGSSQSAGRALVAVFAPKSRLAEFYSFWNMALWLSSIVGPLSYGAITWASGNNQRLAIMVTGLFFVAALLALAPISLKRGAAAKAEAERAEEAA